MFCDWTDPLPSELKELGWNWEVDQSYSKLLGYFVGELISHAQMTEAPPTTGRWTEEIKVRIIDGQNYSH